MPLPVGVQLPGWPPAAHARAGARRGRGGLAWAIDHWMGLVPLERWDRSRFAAAVTESIRRHPVEIAQAALTLHHLWGGRFILGIGAGERENVDPYGLS